MKTTFTFRHAQSQDEVRQLAQERLDKLEKYFHRPLEATVVVTQEKFRFHTEIMVSADGTHFTGKDEGADLLAGVDKALAKIENQAQRHHEKHKHKKGKDHESGAAPEGPAGAEAGARVIRSDRFTAKPLSVEDALILLRENGDQFLMFRNAATENINVLYRRTDGHFGLIEPDHV